MVDIFNLSTRELKSLVIYKDVIEKGKRFPRNFWSEEKEHAGGVKINCRILTRYCLENLAHIEAADLPKYKLQGMVQIVFNHDVLAILKNAYAEKFKDKTLKEWMWSKHGLWRNDDAIIEAVQEMVKKEGIRRVEHIPLLDWKKGCSNMEFIMFWPILTGLFLSCLTLCTQIDFILQISSIKSSGRQQSHWKMHFILCIRPSKVKAIPRMIYSCWAPQTSESLVLGACS